MKEWYVLYTKPRSEKKVAERLDERKFEVYCPLVRTMRQWSDRKKKVQLPMFPSYIFVRVDDYERQSVLMDPGVLNFVFWLGKPATIRQTEMDAIRLIAEKGESVHVEGRSFYEGQIISINEGPFKGLSGTVDKVDKRKITVFIEQLDCVVSFNYEQE